VRAESVDVLHVIPTFDVGGVERYLLDRLPRLRARGRRVAVCGLRGGALLDAYRAAGVPVYVCGMERASDAPRGIMRFAAHLRALQPRIVHSHLFWSDLAVALTRSSAPRARWITTKHDEATWMSAGTRVIERWMARRVDAIVADSRGVERARAALNAGGPPCRVIYLSARDVGPGTPDDRAVARATFELPESGLVYGAAARLHPVKGLDVLMDAWRVVEETVPHAHLLLAGDGPAASSLRAQAAAVHDPARIHLVGLRHDMHNVFRALDVLVLPSRSEGFPVSVIEAMSYGLPVIASRVGGVDEAVSDARTGMLVPAGEARPLAAAMCALAADGARRRALGSAAREEYLARFTPEREIAALLALYDEVGA
jgi:glycosyltransferase involved in cell wall biosynthesis